MTYLISITDAIEEISKGVWNEQELIDRIKALPSADADRPLGEWQSSMIPNERYVCSVCGGACWYYDCKGDVAKSNFCPNCGARMKGGAE